MFKKNTRKRLLAGALATVMMLTMCPSWALADDEDIALLPANEEIAVPVDDSIPAADPTKTPAVPTPSETEAKPAENQNTAPAPSDDEANGGTDSTETGNSTNPTVSEGSENNSQNNDVVSNSPENEISTQALQISLPWDKPKEAMYFILLPKCGTPDDNHDQGQENYLPSSDDEETGTTGSDGGVEGLSASTGYPGSITAKAKRILDRQGAIDGFDNDNGLNETGYLKVPDDLGFFTASNWNPNGTYKDEKNSNTDEAARNALLSTDDFTFTPDAHVEIVWYTIKQQNDGIHVDGYLRGVPISVTYHTNYEGNNITGMTEGSKEVSATSGYKYTVESFDSTGLACPDNYTFGGWYVDRIWNPDSTKYNAGSRYLLTGDLHLYAKWDPKPYTVTWESEGTTLGTENVAYNHKPTQSYTPTKDADNDYTYTFKGWAVNGNTSNIVESTDIAVTADVTYVAVFDKTERKYTVTWKNEGTTLGTEKVAYNHKPTQSYTPTKDADNAYTYTFKGWAVNGDTNHIVKSTDIAVTADVTYIAVFDKTALPKNYNYTVNKHFYNEKGAEVKVDNGTPQPAVENTAVSELYKADAKNQTDKDGKTYVYVPGLTTVTDKLETLTANVTIDLHYYLNVEGGNDIPDAWEHRLTFKVVNGEWNDGGNADIVTYVQFKDQKTGEAFKDEAVVVPVTRIPAVGDKPNSGYHAGAWDTSPYDNYKVQKDTVFTYTYAKNSSGGSSGGSHHRKPTVTIPDKVPTGLNGNDHYAYIVGYPDKTVRPQNGITRAEVATIFFRLLTDETRNANSTKSNSYSDVAAGAWYNHAVSTLSAMGIVKGDSDGKFNPNAPITRAEFAAIAARFDDKANTTTADFSDIASHWAKNEISAASNNGWINGYPDGTFRPDNKITRAEAMTLVNRVLKRLPETAEDLHDDMIKWSDNSDASQWFYLAVQEATNSHYYQTKENQFEKWSELRDTRDWTELEK